MTHKPTRQRPFPGMGRSRAKGLSGYHLIVCAVIVIAVCGCGSRPRIVHEPGRYAEMGTPLLSGLAKCQSPADCDLLLDQLSYDVSPVTTDAKSADVFTVTPVRDLQSALARTYVLGDKGTNIYVMTQDGAVDQRSLVGMYDECSFGKAHAILICLDSHGSGTPADMKLRARRLKPIEYARSDIDRARERLVAREVYLTKYSRLMDAYAFRYHIVNETGTWTGVISVRKADKKSGTWEGTYQSNEHGSTVDIRDIHYDGETIRFLRPHVDQQFTGTVSDGNIRGSFTWVKATYAWSATVENGH